MKKIISLLLTVIMVVSLFPVMALADTTPQYRYTEYENWQLKHEGSEWQWTENLVKVGEGLFKLADAYWTGSGFNVGSDANPIKKDWFAPEELALGEELIPPITVDIFLRVIDNETVRIGVGVEPAAPTTYAITNGTAEDDKETNNGYISIDKATAAKDATVTVTVTPSEGYALKTLTVSKTDEPETTVSAAKQADGTYKFTMPAYAVTVTATFDEIIDITSWVALQGAINGATGMATIKLTQDLTVPDDPDGASSVNIPAGKDITIDLNGNVLNANGKFSVITINGGTLTVIDGDTTAEHAGYVDANGLWHLAEEGHPASGETAVTIKGGIITGGSTTNGGGVNINSGTFTMNGGNIAGNTASTQGGGVNIGSGTFTMNGGTISGCSAGNFGGGVNNYMGTFTMNGGMITDCYANNVGGAVSFGSTVAIYGGIITGNTARNSGGGIYANGNSFTVGGNAIVKGNTNISGKADNVYLPNKTITLGKKENAPKNGMNIGVSMQTPPTAGFAKPFTTNGAVGDLKYFFSDNTAYYVNFYTDHFELKAPAASNKALNVIQSEHGTVTASEQEATEGNPITLTVAPDEGYQLKSLTVAYNDGEDKTCELTPGDGNTYTFTMPAANVTVTAEFEAVYAITNGTTDTNGSITVASSAAEGETVTVTVTANGGYALKTLKYNDGTDHDITKDATTGEYQFTMPAKAITVTAEFELIPEKEPEEPERKSYTTVTIGGNKEKTKADEKAEENPDTGAPVMNLGAVAVVLGAAYVISKKH